MNDDSIQNWGLKQIHARGWDDYFWWVIIGVGIGYIIGWRVHLKKTRAESSEITERTRAASAENWTKLETLRKSVISKGQVLDMTQQNMRNALLANKEGANNTDALRMCRDEMCNIFQNEYLPALSGYAEMINRLVDSKEALFRAKSELIPDLESIVTFFNMVNLPAMIEKIPASKPYLTRKATRDSLLLRIETMVPPRCCFLRLKIWRIRCQTKVHLQ